MESAPFSLFGENLRPVWRFSQPWRSKMRFGQNMLRMTWNERFVQFSWKSHCFPFLERIYGQCDDFDNFDALKCDLAKTCCVTPETSILYNFQEKRTLSLFWREFEARVTISTTLTLKNAIWPKRAAHDLKRAFCTIFMKIALFFLFGENLRPVWRFWQLWRSKMRFGQNVLRMTWKERFVQCSWKTHCFPVLKRISGQCDDFEPIDAQKCDLAKTCCAWPEKSVLYNFHEKRTVFPFWREFETSVTIVRSLTLKKYDLAKTCCAWPETSVLYNFHEKRTVFPFWREFETSVTSVRSLTLKKYDLGKTSCAWPETSVLYNFHGKRTVFRFWREFTASVTILTTLTL